MKNQWPFWLFIIAILVVVVIAMNYQGKQDVEPFGDIFSHEQGALEYEYVSQQPESKTAAAPAVKRPAASEAGSSAGGTAVTAVTVQPGIEVKTPPAAPATAPATAPSTAVRETAPATGSYAVQVLSSKDQKATEAELKRVKDQGFADGYIHRADLGDRGVWYRIYIGKYASMAEAQDGLAKVKQKYPQAFIFKF